MEWLDITKDLNSISNIEKAKALETMKKFDIVWSEDRSLVKHYPIDDTCDSDSPGLLLAKLENMSYVLWLTLNHHLNKVIKCLGSDSEVLRAREVGERQDHPKKLGKIYTCRPHKFNSINKPIDIVQPFMYSCDNLNLGGKLLSGEINFGIEIY